MSKARRVAVLQDPRDVHIPDCGRRAVREVAGHEPLVDFERHVSDVAATLAVHVAADEGGEPTAYVRVLKVAEQCIEVSHPLAYIASLKAPGLIIL
jgi:hypothetical protein